MNEHIQYTYLCVVCGENDYSVVYLLTCQGSKCNISELELLFRVEFRCMTL